MSIRLAPVTVFIVCIGAVQSLSCDRTPSSPLKGQANTTMVFYGKAVDEDGIGLPDARFQYRLEAYPKDWTFETRDRGNEVSTVTAISGPDGRFQLAVTGCKLIRRDASREGYRELHDERTGSDNWFFGLIAWGDLWYKTDADHPAVYVFVKDGVKAVSALPCRGGWDSGGGMRWTLNQPAWPKSPSLKDVVYKPPSI